MKMWFTISGLIVFALISVVFMALPVSLLHGGVTTFGSLSLGKESPIGPGAMTFAPELQIPPSRFYIGVAQENKWCVFDECAPLGARIAAVGGWLQGEDAKQWATIEDFGLKENPHISSVVVVANRKGDLVGIYPNRDMDDLNDLLQVHRTLWE